MVLVFVLIAIAAGTLSLLLMSGIGVLNSILLASLVASAAVLLAGIVIFFRKPLSGDNSRNVSAENYKPFSLLDR